MSFNTSREQEAPIKRTANRIFKQRLANTFLAAITLAASLPAITFAESAPNIIEISCERLPEQRKDSEEEKYLSLKLGERLKRFKNIYIYGTPHAQERAFNDDIARRLGAPPDSIVYFSERQFFRVIGPEQNCVVTPDTPNEVTDPKKFDIPGGIAP